jgi:DNA-binding response OmpR family regulator
VNEVVLLVDDDADSAEVVAELLGTRGITAHAALTGASALKLYEELRPALVIADQKLPDIEGSVLVAKLREKFGAAVGPALFMTGLKSSVKSLPTDIVLEKPVDFDTLLSVVEKLLRR